MQTFFERKPTVYQYSFDPSCKQGVIMDELIGMVLTSLSECADTGAVKQARKSIRHARQILTIVNYEKMRDRDQARAIQGRHAARGS